MTPVKKKWRCTIYKKKQLKLHLSLPVWRIIVHAKVYIYCFYHVEQHR